MLSRSTYCCEALSSYCILRIYSATQGYNVVLCCMMIKLAVEGCIGTGKRGILECVLEETWSLIIDGTCLLIMNLKLSSTISLSTIVTYPFLIIVLSKLFPRVFSASTSEMAATDSVESGCGLACRHLGFAM